MLPAYQRNLIIQRLRVNLTAFAWILEVRGAQDRVISVFSPPGQGGYFKVLLIFGGSAQSEGFGVGDERVAVDGGFGNHVGGIAALPQDGGFQADFAESAG